MAQKCSSHGQDKTELINGKFFCPKCAQETRTFVNTQVAAFSEAKVKKFSECKLGNICFSNGCYTKGYCTQTDSS